MTMTAATMTAMTDTEARRDISRACARRSRDDLPQYFTDIVGDHTEVTERDEGYGWTEAWGVWDNHVHIVRDVSVDIPADELTDYLFDEVIVVPLDADGFDTSAADVAVGDRVPDDELEDWTVVVDADDGHKVTFTPTRIEVKEIRETHEVMTTDNGVTFMARVIQVWRESDWTWDED